MPHVTIEGVNLRKDFAHQTIFEGISFTYQNTDSIAVTGANGSGKSTLLRMISGMVTITEGQIRWSLDGRKLPTHHTYEYLSFCSPGFHFDDRFTVREIIKQYCKVKPLQHGMSPDDLIGLIGFGAHSHKLISELSSGMNQRVRLVLTLCTQTPVLFLDEPCTNLDQQGVEWYQEMVDRFCSHKLVFVASNDPREYLFCKDQLSLMDYLVK